VAVRQNSVRASIAAEPTLAMGSHRSYCIGHSRAEGNGKGEGRPGLPSDNAHAHCPSEPRAALQMLVEWLLILFKPTSFIPTRSYSHDSGPSINPRDQGHGELYKQNRAFAAIAPAAAGEGSSLPASVRVLDGRSESHLVTDEQGSCWNALDSFWN
jgi:hypothetical protein